MTDRLQPAQWPAEKPVMRPIGALRPHPRNARQHPPEQLKVIAELIRTKGWTNRVLIDGSDQIIAGHGRVEAAKLLGITEIPCIVADDWTDEEVRAYLVADNQTTLAGEWDLERLREELGALGEAGIDLAGLGFDADELAALLNPPVTALNDPEDTPAPPANPTVKSGEVWVLGNHRLICGDCTSADDVKRALAGAKPHLMVTDPPYGVNYDPSWRARAGVNLNEKKLGKVSNDDRADWTEAWALYDGEVAYVWHGGLHAGTVEASLAASGFVIRSQIVWAKDRFALSRGDYHWQHEPCWYAVRKGKRGLWAGDRSQSTVWNIPAREDGGHTHGTQKPLECMARPIRNNSKPGDAVYEPFAGSGTALIACEMEGRVCYAIEIEPAYCDVIIQRWQNAFGGEAVRESDGAKYSELEPEFVPEAVSA